MYPLKPLWISLLIFGAQIINKLAAVSHHRLWLSSLRGILFSRECPGGYQMRTPISHVVFIFYGERQFLNFHDPSLPMFADIKSRPWLLRFALPWHLSNHWASKSEDRTLNQLFGRLFFPCLFGFRYTPSSRQQRSHDDAYSRCHPLFRSDFIITATETTLRLH